MNFETNKDVLDWYERQERTLTPEFLGAIPWEKVKDDPIDPKFIPALLYMRDVETLTDMYHRELLRSPTGKDRHIGKFMERWGVEEITHGEVIDRFLNEIGVESGPNWQAEVRRSPTVGYHANTFLLMMLGHLVGKRFTATHMTFGAIHEMEAAQGYRRLSSLAKHPVLSLIVDGIIREEASHASFYRHVAILELKKSTASQKLTRYFVEKFWAPVGAGSLAKLRTDYMVTTLFGDEEGLALFDKTVTQRLRLFPGFTDITATSDTMARIVATNSLKPSTSMGQPVYSER